MQVELAALSGVLIVTPRVFADPRGFFFESYNQEKFRGHGIETVFVQDNHSKSARGTLRGRHFQVAPMAQVKLVRCVRGAIWDVAVDIRTGSPTFGQWVGAELTADNFKQIYMPIGFAHGFCVLSDEAEVLYKTSVVYSQSHEQGIAWNDLIRDARRGFPHPCQRSASDPPSLCQRVKHTPEGSPRPFGCAVAFRISLAVSCLLDEFYRVGRSVACPDSHRCLCAQLKGID
ncbi:MAG: dTDP-4-dehydrorhamnose 3,5-epimerase, partial [Candidatus Anoxymicrobium japonicum]